MKEIQLSKEQQQQLHARLTIENIARLKVCVWIVILLGGVVLRDGPFLQYYALIYILLLSISAIILFVIYKISKIRDANKQIKYYFNILRVYYAFLLIWGVAVTIMDQRTFGNVTVYLTNLMIVTLFFVVSPKQYIIVHTIPVVSLFLGIFFIQENVAMAIEHFINITVFIIFCMIGSRMIYANYCKGFNQKMQLSIKNEELAILATVDYLTQVNNVLGMKQYIEEQNKKPHDNITVMLFDIDSFKLYNDHYGHLAGDDVLKNVALAVKKVLLHDHYIARVGGEEFIIIAYDLSNHEASQLAEKVRFEVEKLKLEHTQSKTSPYITISLGYVTEQVSPNHSFSSLHQKADEALYRVKENGRNQTQGYMAMYN